MKKRFVYSTVLGLVTAAAAACGGGSDDRLLSSLGDQDFIDLCESQSFSDAQLRGLAGLDCLLEELFMETCDDARLAACIETTFQAYKDGPSGCEAPGADDPVRSCGATVDDYQACATAELNQLIPLGSATCADLEGGGEEERPAACVALEEQCPELGDDSSPQ